MTGFFALTHFFMDYFERESRGWWDCKPWPRQIKRIPFWTLAVERNA